jgi:Tol biopolymer transport system component
VPSLIYLLELATGHVTQITHHLGGADQSSFSHDGKLLAFRSGASTYTIRIDGTDERHVIGGTDWSIGYRHPHFTLDDKELVVDRLNEIDVVSLDGAEQRVIVQNVPVAVQQPSLSPSGRDVVYEVACAYRLSLWSSPLSVNTNPCEGVRITPVSLFNAEHASWGPNDRIVYARTGYTNRGQIAIVTREPGATPCAVTNVTTDSRNPAWYFETE